MMFPGLPDPNTQMVSRLHTHREDPLLIIMLHRNCQDLLLVPLLQPMLDNCWSLKEIELIRQLFPLSPILPQRQPNTAPPLPPASSPVVDRLQIPLSAAQTQHQKPLNIRSIDPERPQSRKKKDRSRRWPPSASPRASRPSPRARRPPRQDSCRRPTCRLPTLTRPTWCCSTCCDDGSRDPRPGCCHATSFTTSTSTATTPRFCCRAIPRRHLPTASVPGTSST